jgi:5-methylcytosine-specific restriction endonuclease McrA
MFKAKKEPYGRALFCSRECFKNCNGIKNPTKRLDIEFKTLRDRAAIGKKEIKIILGMVVINAIGKFINTHKNSRPGERVGKTRRMKCNYCNSIFKSQITMGGPPKYCALCRPKVVDEQRRIGRQVAKAKRRSRCRNSVYEPVDPIKVFNRDKWKCHICGTSTPKELRGSYLGNAPELDHIVTLADGGSHTYGNVACACRSCNGKKGARSCGQIRIF